MTLAKPAALLGEQPLQQDMEQIKVCGNPVLACGPGGLRQGGREGGIKRGGGPFSESSSGSKATAQLETRGDSVCPRDLEVRAPVTQRGSLVLLLLLQGERPPRLLLVKVT